MIVGNSTPGTSKFPEKLPWKQTQLQKLCYSLVLRRLGRSGQEPTVFFLIQPMHDLLNVIGLLFPFVLQFVDQRYVAFLLLTSFG